MSDCRREVPFGIRFMTIVSLGKSSSTSLKNGVCMIVQQQGIPLWTEVQENLGIHILTLPVLTFPTGDRW